MKRKKLIVLIITSALCSAVAVGVGAVCSEFSARPQPNDNYESTAITDETDTDVAVSDESDEHITVPETACMADTAEQSANDAVTDAVSEQATAAAEYQPPVKETADTLSSDPYPVSENSSEVFASSLFIGDSRTLGLSQYADLGNSTVFASCGMNVFRVFNDTLDVPGIGSTTLQGLLSGRQYSKIYLMLGMNEIGYDHSYVVSRYGNVISQLKAFQPNAVIYIEANLHIVKSRSDTDSIYNNASLNALNSALRSYANGTDIFYIDVNPVFDDGEGNLNSAYTVDDFHLIGKYYALWGRWLADTTA